MWSGFLSNARESAILINEKLIYVFRLIDHWPALSMNMQSAVTKAVILIPVVGYLILWSDELRPYLSNELLAGAALIPLPIKLYLLYFGALFILVAYCIHATRCPRVLKNQKSKPELFSYIVADGNYMKARSLVLSMHADMNADNFDDYPSLENKLSKFLSGRSSTGARRQIGEISDSAIWSALDRIDSVERKDLVDLSDWYFDFLTGLAPKSRYACTWFFLVGGFMMLIPSIELFFRVIIKIFINLF